MKTKNKFGLILIFTLFTTLFLSTLVSAQVLDIDLTPTNSTGHLQPNTNYKYELNFTTDVACTGVVMSKNFSITTDVEGRYSLEVDLGTLTTFPNYICEYRNDTLRKIHNISSQIIPTAYIDDIYLNQNITLINNDTSYLGSLNNWLKGIYATTFYEGGQALSSLYCSLFGCTMTGDLNMGDNHITYVNTINVTNNTYVHNLLSYNANSINIQPTGDEDDFFSFKTIANRPTIKREGGKYIYFESSNVYDMGISLRKDDTYSGTLNYEKDNLVMTLLGKNSPVGIKANSAYGNYIQFETYDGQPQIRVVNGTVLKINDSLYVIGDGNFTGDLIVTGNINGTKIYENDERVLTNYRNITDTDITNLGYIKSATGGGNTTEEMQDAVGTAFGEGLDYVDGTDSMTFDCSEVTDSVDDHLGCSGENIVVEASIFDSLVPIGAVLPWYNYSSTGTIPVRFMECNGDIISDASSPLNGMATPNLVGRYIKGSSGADSNTTTGSATHNHQWQDATTNTGDHSTYYDSAGNSHPLYDIDGSQGGGLKFVISASGGGTNIIADTYTNKASSDPLSWQMIYMIRIK